MTSEFTELTIRIRAKNEAGGYYPVEAELGDGSRYEDGRLRLDHDVLLEKELDPLGYGETLFSALFAGDILEAYHKATGRAAGATDGRLRVQLWLDADAVELHAIPWERLYHFPKGQAVPLTTSTHTPFSRYTSLEQGEPEPVADRPIRLLAAIASPSTLPGGMAEVEVPAEVANLRTALGDLREAGKLSVTLLPGRSGLPADQMKQLKDEGWEIAEGNTTLENILRHLPGQHVLHFIGHGQFRRRGEGSGQAVLFLEKEDGAWQAVPDDQIVPRFAAIGEPPHLVYLVACESASREAKGPDAFVGLGPKLVQAGVPAVVAMQALVPVHTARKVTGEFYRRLMEHGVVDQAMSQARLLAFDTKRTDWGIPVLFMRLKTGELFGKKSAADGSDEQSAVSQVAEAGGVNIATGAGEGGINFGNIGGSVNVGGSIVGRDQIVTDRAATNEGAQEMVVLKKQMEKAVRQVDALTIDDADKDDLKDLILKIEGEAKKGEAANIGRIERWLGNLNDISPEILKAVVKALTNVAAGVAEPIQQAARKAGG